MSNENKYEIRVMTIDDYDEVYSLWQTIHGFGIRSIDDSREGAVSYTHLDVYKRQDYVLYTYSYVSDAWSFDAGGRGEALLCASYKDEVRCV